MSATEIPAAGDEGIASIDPAQPSTDSTPQASPPRRRVRVVKNDAVLTSQAAVELAAQAAREIADPGTVGEHLGVHMDAERLATHYFASLAKAYPDWRWAVTVARAPRAKNATICETNLVPSTSSVLAPEWVPYADRLAPGDLGAGDVLPYKEDDPRLEAGFEATGNEDVDQIAFFELGLGRQRVLSAQGREEAAQRWYDGAHGPKSDVARKAPASCATCGYFLPMAGVLRQQFGVCANDWSPSDGKVVSLDHGCGAHSEVDMDAPEPHEHQDKPVLDELDVELEVDGNDVAGEDVAGEGVEGNVSSELDG